MGHPFDPTRDPDPHVPPEYQAKSERDLRHRYHEGDHHAHNELWRRNRNDFERIASRRCKNEHDARDLLQQTQLNLTRKHGSYDPSRDWRPYAYRILINTFISIFHRKGGKTPTSMDPVVLGNELIQEVPTAFQEGLEEDMKDCLQRLPEEQRVMLVMTGLEGWKQGEAAKQVFGFGDTWASTVVEKAHKAMSDCLSRKGYGG
jgi:RNA polymerase sigma-70 factor, ECF subfamily